MAVLFDCDGVLIDSEVVGLEDAVTFLGDNGLAFARDDLIRRFTGMRSDRLQRELRGAYDEALGRPSTDQEFTALFDGFVETRRARRHEVQLIDGAEQTLAVAARHEGFQIAVASSSGQSFLDDKIDRFGLRPFVGHHVYSADSVAHGKPAPDIFLYAADRLGADMTKCLIIEDSPNGVMAGIAAGATVWGFVGGGHCLTDHAGRLEACGASRIFKTHADLGQALEAL
ncbi:MAG: HAD family hydrolase [Parvularcula sp.]